MLSQRLRNNYKMLAYKRRKRWQVIGVTAYRYGNLLQAFGSPIQFVGKTITAEALALREALENAHGWSKVDFVSMLKYGGYDTYKK
ncbi:hypothetical protein HAX54_036223 [Datura stramonium]|uniref:RNase H type-1 domain-containing protein n=1 Tax=Datura stramonium TaxID=4076 RepID=A0ABS8VHD0_DATST|nr:hypothetical protein [Datura stramonium]